VRSQDAAGDQAAERSVVETFEPVSRSSREQANIRKRVVQLGVLIAFITFLDRACLGEAAPFIMRDLHLSKLQMGYVFSAFGLTYTILELPSGWLVDQLGVRSILTRITFIWSLLTAATGMAWSYGSLFTIRLLFGAGEAGCYPAIAKAFRDWLPEEVRPRAEGWKTLSSRWGAAIAPPLFIALNEWMGWRQVFYAFGLIGGVTAVIFYWQYRDVSSPENAASASELTFSRQRRAPVDASRYNKTPWREFAGSRSLWALSLQWFCHYYGFYFYITWLPIYLQQTSGLTLKNSAVLAGLPMLFAGAGTLTSGYLLPPLMRMIGTAAARRLIAYVSFGGAAVLLLVLTRTGSPYVAVAVMSLSAFLAEGCAPVTWVTAMDLGGSSVGTLTGVMNGLGQLGAMIAPAAIGLILTISHNNWTLTFYVSAAFYGLGGLCWMILDPVTAIESRKA
jgi:MFS family permease